MRRRIGFEWSRDPDDSDDLSGGSIDLSGSGETDLSHDIIGHDLDDHKMKIRLG